MTTLRRLRLVQPSTPVRGSMVRVAYVTKCHEGDAEPGKPWCIYSHKKGDVKGFPKHFRTKGEANAYLKQMETFEHS